MKILYIINNFYIFKLYYEMYIKAETGEQTFIMCVEIILFTKTFHTAFLYNKCNVSEVCTLLIKSLHI